MKSVLLGFAAAAALATSASAMTVGASFQSPTGLLEDAQSITVDGLTITVSDLASAGGGILASVAPIPEPGTWAMMLVGVGGLGGMLRARRKSSGAGVLSI